MTSRYQHPAHPGPPRITVRAAMGQLRVVSVWQAFGRCAAHAQRRTVHGKRKKGLEEMTVTFESISLAELAKITRGLNALPWVSAASMRVATGAIFLERDRS